MVLVFNIVTANCISVLQRIVHNLNQKIFCTRRSEVHESAYRNISVINEQCSFLKRIKNCTAQKKLILGSQGGILCENVLINTMVLAAQQYVLIS